MAGTSSNWTTLGSNTNSTINTDTGDETNIDNTQSATSASGTNNQVRHECHMWLIDGDDTETKDFNWAINGNFTVVLGNGLCIECWDRKVSKYQGKQTRRDGEL